MSFCLVCVMVFFLPDLRAKTTNEVRDVYEKLPDLFLAPHLPVPPPADPFGDFLVVFVLLSKFHKYSNSAYNAVFNSMFKRSKFFDLPGKDSYQNNANDALPRPLRPPSARHVEDWEKLQRKIQEEDAMKVLPKPAILDQNKDPSRSSSSASPPRAQPLSEDKVLAPPPGLDHHLPSIATHMNGSVITQGGEDPDPETRSRRDFIRKVTKPSHFFCVK